MDIESTLLENLSAAQRERLRSMLIASPQDNSLLEMLKPEQRCQYVEALLMCSEGQWRRARDLAGRAMAQSQRGGGFGSEGMVDLAKAVAMISRVAPDDDVIAAMIVMCWADRMVGEELFGLVLQLGRWAEYAFPRVKLTTKQCAALMLTDVGADDLDAMVSPWRSFCISLQPGSLPCIVDGSHTEVSEIHVLRQVTKVRPRSDVPSRNGRYSMRAVVGNGRFLWENNRTAHELYKDVRENHPLAASSSSEECEASEVRALTMACRLVANVCMVLTDRERLIRDTPSKAERKRNRQSVWSLLPFTSYVVGLPVTVDATEWVRDYLIGGADRFRKVRWVVRGHYRNQVCGTGRLERRRTWIEPYWKGPDRAPILTRPHQLRDHGDIDANVYDAPEAIAAGRERNSNDE